MRQESRLDLLMRDFVSKIQGRLESQRWQLDARETAIKMLVGRLLESRRQQMRLLEEKLHLMDPQRMLKRGYSITLYKGCSVKDASSLKPGSEIETRLAKGVVKSIVK